MCCVSRKIRYYLVINTSQPSVVLSMFGLFSTLDMDGIFQNKSLNINFHYDHVKRNEGRNGSFTNPSLRRWARKGIGWVFIIPGNNEAQFQCVFLGCQCRNRYIYKHLTGPDKGCLLSMTWISSRKLYFRNNLILNRSKVIYFILQQIVSYLTSFPSSYMIEDIFWFS